MPIERRRSRQPGRPRKPGAPAVDPSTINPRAVLAGLASDPATPATARVAACKALLRLAGDPIEDDCGPDELTKRALLNMRKPG